MKHLLGCANPVPPVASPARHAAQTPPGAVDTPPARSDRLEYRHEARPVEGGRGFAQNPRAKLASLGLAGKNFGTI